MAERMDRSVREALDRVREAASALLESIVAPYEAVAATDPRAVLGAPVSVAAYVSPVSLRALAESIAEHGRNAWSLKQVEAREVQVRELVDDYRAGRYSTTPTADWIAKVNQFRDGVLSDINTALQAPRSYEVIDLANPGNHHGHLDKELLTPRDVAPELKIGERSVRKRIVAGNLGPWKKDGGRWVISREAFMRFWEEQVADADLPRARGGEEEGKSAFDALDHYRL